MGGVVISVDGDHGELALLFVSPDCHSRGLGYAAWYAIEKMHPEVKIWETATPYFENEISIFTSISVVFTLSSFITVIIRILMIQMNMKKTISFPKVCSNLRK